MNALPAGVVFEQRAFPNANLLLLLGESPTLIDTGFVSCAGTTAALVREHAPRVSQVANTHWHSDHVGGNAHFQHAGAEIIGSPTDAAALGRADPGCCLAVGDALSSYDVGWVNVMLEGPSALDAAAESLTRLRELDARIIIPGHGPSSPTRSGRWRRRWSALNSNARISTGQ